MSPVASVGLGLSVSVFVSIFAVEVVRFCFVEVV